MFCLLSLLDISHEAPDCTQYFTCGPRSTKQNKTINCHELVAVLLLLQLRMLLPLWYPSVLLALLHLAVLTASSSFSAELLLSQLLTCIDSWCCSVPGPEFVFVCIELNEIQVGPILQLAEDSPNSSPDHHCRKVSPLAWCCPQTC